MEAPEDKTTFMESLLEDAFAPWIQQIGIAPHTVTDQGARFSVPTNPELSREGGIVCGQAIAAVADTVGVLTLCAHNGEYRAMTTVDMTTHFMRPVMDGAMEVEAFIQSNGKRMATVRIECRQEGKPKLCAASTCAYAYLDL